MPTKKKAARSSKKRASARPVTIKYQCVSGTCVAKKKRSNLGPAGSHVSLVAVNRDVSIVFDLQSPFASGAGFPASNPITIPSGSKQLETVGSANGTFS